MHNRKVNICKCNFAQPEITILRHSVVKNCVPLDPEKAKAILKTTAPNTITDPRGLPRISGNYRRLIRNFADNSSPLYATNSVELKL